MDWNLKKHPTFGGVRGPVVVVVMDGVGCGSHDDGDAVWLARTPWLDFLGERALSTQLRAHGTAVGLPSEDDMGNSEVGHNAFGAGRVFDQGAKRVKEAIESEELFRGDEWRRIISGAREAGEAVHFLGLLSDGNVHSHVDHLFAMVRRCREEQVRKVRVHMLTDGRDVPDGSALEYVDRLEELLRQIRDQAGFDYLIASGGGRMRVTMDRYGADWGMVALGWKTHVLGEGAVFPSARNAIEALRKEFPGVGDQYLPAFVIGNEGKPVGPIRPGSSLIFFNFRGDRAVEFSRAIEDDDFHEFDRGPKLNITFAGMMQYDGDKKCPKHFLVQPPPIDRTVGEYLARNGVTQLACSETQKFGHVTYFWNGNRSGMFDPKTERYLEVPSDRLPFEERPWMKAAEITDRVIDNLKAGSFRHARLNYANGDMVGHTGVLTSSIVAIEAVDISLGRLITLTDQLEGALIVTADHGNADDMFERNKKTGAYTLDGSGKKVPKTSHSLNPVPFHIYAPTARLALDGKVKNPGLANVAATALHLMGYQRPEGYEPSLIEG